MCVYVSVCNIHIARSLPTHPTTHASSPSPTPTHSRLPHNNNHPTHPRDYRLRVLLCLVDVEDSAEPLLQVNRMALLEGCTLLLAWSTLEAARCVPCLGMDGLCLGRLVGAGLAWDGWMNG